MLALDVQAYCARHPGYRLGLTSRRRLFFARLSPRVDAVLLELPHVTAVHEHVEEAVLGAMRIGAES